MRTTLKTTRLDELASRLRAGLGAYTTAPMAAVELAELLGLSHLNREVARRTVREVVTWARQKHGVRVCASMDGYWLAQSPAEWEAYLAAVKSHGAWRFADAAAMRKAAIDAGNRQPSLFGAGNEATRQRGSEWATR